MRLKWQWFFNACRGYAYWRGVRDVFGSWKAMRGFQNTPQLLPTYMLDLTYGLPYMLNNIWVEGPGVAQIYCTGKFLGNLEIESAVEEPLTGRLVDELVKKMRIPLSAAFFAASYSSSDVLTTGEGD
jgi:hypothetical protein